MKKEEMKEVKIENSDEEEGGDDRE